MTFFSQQPIGSALEPLCDTGFSNGDLYCQRMVTTDAPNEGEYVIRWFIGFTQISV